MTAPQTEHRAIPGPASTDRLVWLAARRNGVTATEIRDSARGSSTDRRRIIMEKVTDTDTPDLSGNRYIKRGHTREPVIAEWIGRRFNIETSGLLYAHPTEPRHLATPDCYSIDPMTGEVLLAEIKTSKHDLWPFETSAPASGIDTLRPATALALRTTSRTPFWTSGYYDQMQWQMHVLGAKRTLFVYEQHDNEWPDPKPLGEPVAVWVERDERRIAELLTVAESLLADIERATIGDLPTSLGTIPVEIADDVHRLLEFRNAEAVAKSSKETVWTRLKAFYKDRPADMCESDEAKVTWSPTKTEQTTTWLDPKEGGATAAQLARIAKAEAAIDAAKAAWAKRADMLGDAQQKVNDKRAALDALLEPWRTTQAQIVKVSTPLTVTAKRTTTKEG